MNVVSENFLLISAGAWLNGKGQEKSQGSKFERRR